MGLFAKTFLRWTEPKLLRRTEMKEAARSFNRMSMVAVIASLGIILLSRFFVPDATIKLAVVSGIILAFMYIILIIYNTFPSCVRVSGKGISQTVTGDDETTWKFKDISHCEITTTEIAGTAIRILVIEMKDGDKDTVGISDGVSLQELTRVLTERGVHVTNSKPASG